METPSKDLISNGGLLMEKYNFRKASERFRALEDGHILQATNNKDDMYSCTFSLNQKHTEFNCALIVFGEGWSWRIIKQQSTQEDCE